MIKSMTAFASGEKQMANIILNCELRSVNHRYCDISFRLPDHLRFAENELRQLINSHLKRGKIDCIINYKNQSNQQPTIEINQSAVKALLQATEQIEEHMYTQHPFSALEVLNFPGIQKQPEINKTDLLNCVKSMLNEVLEQLIDERKREGQQLAQIISERCQQTLILVDSANKRLPKVLEHLKTKIKTRLHELVIDPDFDRLEQEMVMLAQKMDVAEELDRLETHIKEVLNTLNSQEIAGRRLDFLMQEMNREANTLGSKSSDKIMTQISIDLKVMIEQMREQVQNIE